MTVYRLSAAKFSNDLSGKGAEKSGGRWNSIGTAILYTSDSRALCTAEIAVHTPLGSVPANYRLVSIELPTNCSMQQINPNELPSDWKSFPPTNSTQKIGDLFAKNNQHLILKVPSCVVPGDFNYLINPNHPDFKQVEIKSIVSFDFDDRLFRK